MIHILSNKILILCFTLLLSFISSTSYAHGDKDNAAVKRELLTVDALANIPQHQLTSVRIELATNMSVPAHKHQGFVFVYVLEGTVRSQLNDEEIKTYQKGDVWTEPPGVTHSLTENASDSKIAKILAVFVAHKEAILSTSAEIK